MDRIPGTGWLPNIFLPFVLMKGCAIFLILLLPVYTLFSQEETEIPEPSDEVISLGWADNAVSAGYVTAPSVLGLMFISALVSEWNAGYFGIPASAMILLAPPLIYAGGRSVTISGEYGKPRAQLGWTLYALSLVPTALALYGFTTDWGSTLPLTIASGVLGSASIIAMTTYAYVRDATGREMNSNSRISINAGLYPIPKGAMASISITF